MQLTDEHIAQFQMLYLKHFGRNISRDEALEKGMRLVRLVEIVERNPDDRNELGQKLALGSNGFDAI